MCIKNHTKHRIEQPFFEKRVASQKKIKFLSETVTEFYQVKVKQDQQPIFVIPDGCIDLIFSYNAINPEGYVFGSSLDMHDVPLKPNISYFGIRFFPGIIPNFIQASAEEIFDNSLNFTEIVNYPNDFMANINNQSDINQQIDIFLNTFSTQLNRRFSVTTKFVIKSILEGDQELNIKSLEEKTGYCSRHIQRIFKQDVGTTIKAFSCIMRFQSAVHALTDRSSIKLAHLTYDLGYNDQAHFHKEFKKFINMSPSGFIKYLDQY